MKLVYIFLLTISISAFGQGICKLVNQSPDKKFSLSVTTKELTDLNTEWNYWVKGTTGDSILLTTSILHDMPAPVAYWDKSSTKLIYEEQTYDKSEIRIYDLIVGKLIFQTNGFIWGHNMEYFDQANGIVIFFRQTGAEHNGNFDILSLDVATHAIKVIRSVKTSGDPYTGAPEILTMNRVKREIILSFQTISWDVKIEKLNY